MSLNHTDEYSLYPVPWDICPYDSLSVWYVLRSLICPEMTQTCVVSFCVPVTFPSVTLEIRSSTNVFPTVSVPWEYVSHLSLGVWYVPKWHRQGVLLLRFARRVCIFLCEWSVLNSTTSSSVSSWFMTYSLIWLIFLSSRGWLERKYKYWHNCWYKSTNSDTVAGSTLGWGGPDETTTVLLPCPWCEGNITKIIALWLYLVLCMTCFSSSSLSFLLTRYD